MFSKSNFVWLVERDAPPKGGFPLPRMGVLVMRDTLPPRGVGLAFRLRKSLEDYSCP